MFCNQCQEALNNYGCERTGVCGKSPGLSNLMDILIDVCKGISFLVEKGGNENIIRKDADIFLMESLFSTITNVNFDEKRIYDLIKEGIGIRDDIKKRLNVDTNGKLPYQCEMTFSEDKDLMISEYLKMKNIPDDKDVRSLKDIILFGLKGMAAYAHHAIVLGRYNPEISFFLHSAMSNLITEKNPDNLILLVMKTGEYGVKVMQLLDEANTRHFGHPVPVDVYTGTKRGPAILVSGHDLLDLYELLKQTDGRGINIYTHGEMLPAHSYPELKKFEHLIGNFGTAWHNQRSEFAEFRGAILFTTNCLVKPDESYRENMFTTGTAGYPGCVHIPDRKGTSQKDFSVLIDKALSLPGPNEKEGKYIKTGFGHNTLFNLADKILSSVRSGQIKKFVVMAGCDGRQKERMYYTDFAKKLPEDTVILTAGCAKYRYNMLGIGDAGGIPRVIDAGQCNDSYSLAITAIKLKEILGLDDINKLPIVYNIAWYEQKAVIVLLALLYLGIKNIRLGPSLPAFLSENVLKILSDRFGISGISSAESDLKSIYSQENIRDEVRPRLP